MSKIRNYTIIFDRKISVPQVSKKARENLAEDADLDITTNACCKKNVAKALIIAKDYFIVAGLVEAAAIFKPLRIRILVKEGNLVKKSQQLLEIYGNVNEILRKERTALNYIQILSGIATATNKLVKKFGKKISSLRKVHPGLGGSEKRAVVIGGGLTHRLNLSDGYLIKDNHIQAIRNELGMSRSKAIEIAIYRAFEHRRKNKKNVFVEVEIFSVREALLATQKNVDAILIDNQKPERVREIVNNVRKVNSAIVIEASGNINKKNIGKYLATGVDFVSTSELTIASKPVDVSLEIVSASKE